MQFNEARKIATHLKKFEAEIDSMVNSMGVMAKNHFTANFRKQGFDDEGVEAWKPRKKRERAGRAILVKSGRLRRSINFRKKGKWSVVIATDVPYARRHNEGLDKMPKRQFIGYSGKLNRQIITSFNSKIKRIFA
jgi:phage gpG-like protein